MNPILEVRGLTKRFGGLTAVHDLDFDVREGEILGMIGPNGAGKSTTFNLIAGTYPATTGDVRYAGERLLGLPPHRIAARGVMRTFQHNRPFAAAWASRRTPTSPRSRSARGGSSRSRARSPASRA